MQLTKTQRKAYNTVIRQRAFAESIHFGINTPESRHHQAMWCKRIRTEYPLPEYGTEWGIS